MMGLPAQCLRPAQGAGKIRRQVQNSLIGNGFHLPMIIALMCMLPQVLSVKIPAPVFDPVEQALCGRLQHTIWEPGRLESFPGLSTASSICRDLQDTFSDFRVEASVWAHLQSELDHVPLHTCQAFVAWMSSRTDDLSQLGPTPIDARHRTALFAGLSGQRHPGSSKRGMDHLLPPGLGKTEHVDQAKALPSPFQTRDWPEQDIDFVLHAITVWQIHLPAYAAKCRRGLAQAFRALRPLDEALGVHRGESARRVAAGKRPACVAFLTALLRWPDVQQPVQLLLGYPIVGAIEHSGVFRSVPEATSLSLAEWLGPSAIAAVDKIERSGPPRFHEEILKVTQEEQAKGFRSQFHTRAELDQSFGRGSWRPLERFLF